MSIAFSNIRARSPAEKHHGVQGLYRVPTFVRQPGGYTHLRLLSVYCTHISLEKYPLLSEILPEFTLLSHLRAPQTVDEVRSGKTFPVVLCLRACLQMSISGKDAGQKWLRFRTVVGTFSVKPGYSTN